MLISFIFSYSESFFVLFYPAFIFHSGEKPAHATTYRLTRALIVARGYGAV